MSSIAITDRKCFLYTELCRVKAICEYLRNAFRQALDESIEPWALSES
jgi:hypothetical protein